MDPAKIVQQMRDLEAYNREVEATHPWMPSAYNKGNA
jgi:hypothetical protein